MCDLVSVVEAKVGTYSLSHQSLAARGGPLPGLAGERRVLCAHGARRSQVIVGKVTPLLGENRGSLQRFPFELNRQWKGFVSFVFNF